LVLAASATWVDDGRMNPLRRVVLVAYPEVQPLDVTGPGEVFRAVNRFYGRTYEIELVAPEGGPVDAGSVALVPHKTMSACRGPIDTLLVAGGVGVEAATGDERIVRWVRSAAGRSRRICSVCSGAFLLAEAGLLDGRRATTHWASCEQLAEHYPAVEVDPDPIFVRDGDVYTSAGVTAGMDLALALVEEDCGRQVALRAARQLVMFVKRPGGQSQFSAQLSAGPAQQRPLREIQEWIAGNLEADLTVSALARRANMSERSFARAFRRELGITPATYVTTVRLEAARIELESGAALVEGVARRAGFGTVETMRRAFNRRLGVSPADYRDRFRTATAA
jgi:transcriptional regulator GlxA family with amidase domain